VKNIFDAPKRAASNAFDMMKKSAGVNRDPDLSNYMQLKPEDFDDITQEYGIDVTTKYIAEMEEQLAKRR
jgi:hypothetical protein